MDATKKVDHENVQCPPESKILTNIIKNHPLQFSIASSSFVPWIYMAQFWHALKEDSSKYRLKFMLDKKELSLTLDDFRTIFHLPHANENNHNSFVPPPSFFGMVPFYKQQFGFTIELKISPSFKTTGLLQPWQTLCKIFSKCLTTRVTGWDQPPLQIMQMMYCFVNNIHVDYAELLWEGIYYSLHHPTSSIPYPRFTKIIISHYMTSFPEISRRARDMYHNLQDDDIMKNIFNSGRHKDKVGMQIPDWMITEEMKHTEHYRMYAEVFGLDVPLTQSQPTESTQGTHRTLSAPRSPTPKKDTAESSAPKRSTVIRFRLPERRSTRLTPPAPVPTIDKADEMILQDTLQVSLAEHKSREEQEARENVELVNKHLASEEIEKMVEGSENVIDDSLPPRNDEPQIPGTRLEPMSDKESPEVEITNDEEVEITNVVIPVNVNEEDDEITDEVYELKRREKGKIVEESRSTPFPTPIRSPRTHTNLVSSDTKKLQELTRDFCQGSHHILADHLQEVMVESLPTMVDTHIKEQVKKQVPEQMKFENLQVPQTTCRPSVVRQRIRRSSDDANLEGRMWQSGRSNQEQVDDYDFWTDSYASDDDEILMKQVPQDIIEEVSLTIDEAKLKKMADEMLRQRCTLGDEHQYHIDQMKNFLKSDIVWESRKEILKGSSRPEKIVLSLHKFPTIIFNDDDIEERTSRWVNKCVKKFNPYARYGVKHWNNSHAKIFYIGDKKRWKKLKEEVPEYAETGVEKHKMFSIIYELVHGIIYKNSKKEKRVTRHSEIHKFYDATLNRVLEGLKSYNNNVKYGYEQRELTDDEVEYMKLFEEEIELRLKYHNQMRIWEMYVNGRPLGPRKRTPRIIDP
ncbi:hypothetical protein Tco_0987524 [Tanacetum coccineum]